MLSGELTAVYVAYFHTMRNEWTKTMSACLLRATSSGLTGKPCEEEGEFTVTMKAAWSAYMAHLTSMPLEEDEEPIMPSISCIMDGRRGIWLVCVVGVPFGAPSLAPPPPTRESRCSTTTTLEAGGTEALCA